ncbi:MAG: acetolactate decarboxylase [Zetaproteobacteria bacterium]|nr:acetolactate decarboxylase [Zetaproteobacteria bacterium]
MVSDLFAALPDSLRQSLALRAQATGESPALILEQMLRRGLAVKADSPSLYVSAPVNALVEGIYEENTQISEILEHGDFGLGTFNQLDGEMVVLDGKVFQLKSDGQAYAVEPTVHTPFACVTFFTPNSEELIEQELDFKQLTELLERMIPSLNMIYAIRIEGHFSYVKTRSVPRQESYRPLVEVAREQPEFEFEQIEGVMAGYWTPSFMESLTVPGYHLHFLTADHQHGGHLLACKTRSIRIGIQQLSRLEVGLPMTLDYLTAEFTRDLNQDLQEAEH